MCSNETTETRRKRSNRNIEASEETSRRKHVFAQFARLNLIESQERLKTLEETKSTDETTNNLWLTGETKNRWEANQMAYTIPYKAEYQHTSNALVSDKEDTDNEGNTTSTKLPTLQDNISWAESSIQENDTISDIPFIRGRRFRGKGPSSCRSSVFDFERTSTIRQPSEVPVDEYSSNITIGELKKDFFTNYSPNKEHPIYNNRSYLINSINSYAVVIIQGATGCGKTTQVPAYILEDAIINKKHNESAPVIYVTQPRRIAARSIANRVCDEHGWTLGSIVGYQVGLDKVTGPQTVLIFCTAGVLLQKLIQDKSLKNYTHIIIDEAHERDADTDLLLMMIRTLMRKEGSFFRLIVMSATMDMGKLKSYFTFRTNYGHKALQTPSICLVGQEKLPTNIQIVYHDKLRTTFQVDETMPVFDLEQQEVHIECLRAAVKIIINVIPHLDTFREETKSTLVFLPGLAEINKLHGMLRGAQNFLDIIPLHSCLSSADQVKVFMPARVGCRKVILATNIAESSITVKDVGFIIDFCLTKTLKKDDVTRFPTLKLQWSTMDKCTQRAGRTGRCGPGKVFRMVSHSFFQRFAEYAEPELLTAPLELSVLRVKNFQMGEIKALFAVVLDPPPLQEIRTAVLELKQIGALSSTYNGKLTDLDGDLTELGRVISALPIDVHLSKLIVIASVLDVLEDAIIVAACLSTNRTVVKHLYENLLKSYKSKIEWANGSYSDLFVSLDVYKEYHLKEEQNKSQVYLADYCNRNDLDERKLHEVSALVEELTKRLEEVNMKILEQPNRVRNRYEDELMLKVAFCASFYPNYFLTENMDVQDVQKSLCGLDPTKTVIVHNIPVNEVPLYRSQILDQLKTIDQVLKTNISNDIDYIADCSRALLVFNDNEKMLEDKSVMDAIGVDGIIQHSQDIQKAIYMALKIANCENDRLFIREYKEEVARDRMQYYRDKREQIESINTRKRLLPSWTKIIEGREIDNSRLFYSSDDEYKYITSHNYYIEMGFNVRQDRRDRSELYELEKIEDARNRTNTKKSSEEDIQHPLFKQGYKQLRGPTSPIQMTFRSLLERSKGYNVDIDPLSVNSILLDPDYDKNRRQMLVASTVSQTKRSRIMARDTTLMPNIRGLPTLMSLLFAQYYRVVYNEQMKCLAGAIFGLGWDEDDKPINKQYEVELNFDIHITKDDIELINKARRNISQLIKFIDVLNPGAPRAELQHQLRSIIMTLIRKRRYPLNEISFSSINWGDDEFVKDRHNVPRNQFENLEDGQTRIFLPLMETTKNYSDLDMYATIRKNLDHLDKIEALQAKPPIGGVRCLLCGSGHGDMFLIHSKIVNHINSDRHIEKLKEFEIFEEHERVSMRHEDCKKNKTTQ